MKRILTLALLTIVAFSAWATVTDGTKQTADSLEAVLPSLQGKERITPILKLAEYYRLTNARHAITLLLEGLRLSAEAGNSKTLDFHNQLGICYSIAGQYDSAAYHLKQALAWATKNNDEAGQSRVYANQAILHTYSEQYERALALYFKALDIQIRNNNVKGQMGTYINIAGLYGSLRRYNDALHFDSMGYTLARKLGNAEAAYMIRGNMASTLKDQGDFAAARRMNQEAIDYHEKHFPQSFRLANIYYTMSDIYMGLNKLDSSYSCSTKAWAIYKSLGSLYQLGCAYIQMSNIELAQGQIHDAEQHGLLAYELKDKLGKDFLALSTLNLTKVYTRLGKMDKSFRYESEYHETIDSLERENQAKAVIEMQTKYETQKRIQENERLRHESLLKDAELTKTHYILLSALLGVSLLVVLAVVLFRQNKNRANLNRLLTRENETLKIEKLTAQLNQLKDQISPHFLFNSLSTLQGMVSENDPNTGTFIASLSEVYRYILETDSADLVSVQQELSVAEAYIFLLKTRFSDSLQIDIDLSNEIREKKLPPFSLQLLIENAVKHNVATPSAPLHIVLYADPALDRLCVRNTFQPKRSVTESTKKGLANLQKRLNLLGNYTLNINTHDAFFSVEIPLI